MNLSTSLNSCCKTRIGIARVITLIITIEVISALLMTIVSGVTL